MQRDAHVIGNARVIPQSAEENAFPFWRLPGLHWMEHRVELGRGDVFYVILEQSADGPSSRVLPKTRSTG